MNGNGGVGKDTLCDMAEKHFNTRNISSITPIKEIAKICGWDGTKDDKSRKLLSDLKQVLSSYNDYPTKYILSIYKEFLNSEDDILFVHIREGEEIDKFKSGVDTPIYTILVKRSTMDSVQWGNTSDDQVENYQYDFTFDNNRSLEEIEPIWIKFLSDIIMSN